MRPGLQSGTLVDMKVWRGAVMGMPAKQVAMPASRPTELTIEIKEPKRKQSAARDPGKQSADLFVECNSKPGDKHAEEGRAKNVSGTGQGRDAERFVEVPALRPRCYDEG